MLLMSLWRALAVPASVIARFVCGRAVSRCWPVDRRALDAFRCSGSAVTVLGREMASLTVFILIETVFVVLLSALLASCCPVSETDHADVTFVGSAVALN